MEPESGHRVLYFMWELFLHFVWEPMAVIIKADHICKAMKYDYFLLFTDFISGAAMGMDVRKEFS